LWFSKRNEGFECSRNKNVSGQEQGPVSELCLGCICEAASNCNRSLGCNGDVCGLFRITWAYWADAGKPVIAQDNPNADGGE